MLLRGVNVGRGNRLGMADLRAVLEGVGCTDVRTVLQSGNAVVTADPDGLADRVAEALPLRVRVLVRTADELGAVVAGNPWPDRAATPKQLHAMFLDGMPDAAALAALGTRHGDDELAVGDRVLYLSYASSSLSTAMDRPLARALFGVATTTRNWSTVTKLVELSRRC